jgi:hypothetical protein
MIIDQLVAGGMYETKPMKDLSTEELHEFMKVNFEANFCKSSASAASQLNIWTDD